MSDPEVPKNEKHHDVDDVVGRANEGLDAAAAARGDVSGPDAEANPSDPDMEAFEAAERDYPGTFGASEPVEASDVASPADTSRTDADREDVGLAEPDAAAVDADRVDSHRDAVAGDHAAGAVDETRTASDTDDADATRVIDTDREHHHPTVADTAYAAAASSAATQVVPAEPIAPHPAPQPIFVQAPEPPRELGNRGAAGAIGLVASVAFAILYLGAILGFGALRGEVTGENVGTAALAPLTTWSFWVPVAVFFLSFWLLGAFINRARWGKWVTLGLLVAIATYGGYILGQLFQAPFWRINAADSVELVNEQLLAPLAIASFIFARELTIWFGAWVARSGAKKKRLNAEAQAEYERTLEAGPAALR
ncbi:MFS transporter [Microbacterium esteraromaticum]|uniref:MFS transporter n=1 Tax=Microbacterium esteraromaticum TaxID=57043 RepID=A0A7D8A8X8_9MICO|nr:ABC transporter [Microbacterium esteraromaticum]QMU96181.1 MFS transporter [Microbacterium esteraromaticum]